MINRRKPPVDAPMRQGRLDSRSYRWFAVRVPPQRELVAATFLHDEGFATFVVVRRQFEFANKVQRIKLEKVEVIRPLMPGYCFIGMNHRTPGWDRVFCYRIVHGVIGYDGEPVEIPHDDRPNRPGLRSLMWRQHGGEFNAPGYQRWQQTRNTFKIGDEVVTLDDTLRGRVIDITDRSARVLVNFLGGEREVIADVARLRSVD